MNTKTQVTGLHPFLELKLESRTGIKLEQDVNAFSKKSLEELISTITMLRVKLAIHDEKNSNYNEMLFLKELQLLEDEIDKLMNVDQIVKNFNLLLPIFIHLSFIYQDLNNLVTIYIIIAYLNYIMSYGSSVYLKGALSSSKKPLTQEQKEQGELDLVQEEYSLKRQSLQFYLNKAKKEKDKERIIILEKQIVLLNENEQAELSKIRLKFQNTAPKVDEIH